MSAFYDKKVEKTEVFTFKVNNGGNSGLNFKTHNNTITICFINEKFISVTDTIPVEEKQTLSYIYLQKYIAEKIIELQELYNAPIACCGACK